MILAEPIAVAIQVGAVLDELEIDWLIGGSVASSLHGIPRATQDIDFVAGLFLQHVRPLVAALEGDFYIDADMIRGALRRRASFNIIHLATMTKVDIFTTTNEPLSKQEMSRRQRVPVGDNAHLYLASPEDIILQKLDWYRKSGGVSERQWRDVLGVLKIRGAELDTAYLKDLARRTGLNELLEQVLQVDEGS